MNSDSTTKSSVSKNLIRIGIPKTGTRNPNVTSSITPISVNDIELTRVTKLKIIF